MDLSTTYLGLKLKNPLVAAASPLSKNFDNYKILEEEGLRRSSTIPCLKSRSPMK